MTKKLFRSILLAVSVALTVCFFSITGTLFAYFSDAQKAQLETQLTYAAAGVETQGVSYLQSVKDDTYRLTLIGSDGTVLADTETDAAVMENHADREEVIAALQNGRGRAIRYSETRTEKTEYFAVRLSDGTVLRISVSRATFFSLFLKLLLPLFFVFTLAIAVCALLAKQLSKSIVKPLNEISFDAPLDSNTYEELAPMLKHMDAQNKRIHSQLEDLQKMQNEFDTITANMQEGLVLLNGKGTVVHINAAAKALFSLTDSCVGKDFLTVDRSVEATKCIRTALAGDSAECTVQKNGRDYLLHCSGISESDIPAGAALLLIDVTEKLRAEQNRREFTANVSHELKSPLQSIVGSAELIETGLVKTEDLPRFVGHIKTDAQRLVTLINDIIRLSQLDENSEMAKEPVEIYAMALAVANALTPTAARRNIQIEVQGEETEIVSVRQLVYEILYNLCDNAVKYNQDGGKVTVTVHPEQDKVRISVQDTGIGIAPDQKERIFERFYRVDKSHSKETGGTGLGLSIVKHAVQYLNGQISVESQENMGSVFTVLL
ncbi:MAG: ATP-binding protein [Candidatus Fimenecus sp.]